MNNEIKLLTLNTSLSSNNSISNPAYFLSNSLYNIQGYAVNNFSGENTILNIDSRNNTISFVESAGILTTTIPSGNYTISTFITAIGTAMSNIGTNTYTVTNNTLTNILTVSATGNLSFVNVNNNCYYKMGFSSINNTQATSQIANLSYDLSGIKLIHVVSSSFGSQNNVIANSNYNIICSIPVSAPYLGIINYNNHPEFVSSSSHEINTLQFTLVDELFRNISLQNHWTLSLYVKLS